MIKRPKKLLYNPRFVLIFVFFFPLIVFFVYATQYQKTFFVFLAGALLLSIVYLFYFHLRLSKKQALIELQKQDYLEKANLIEAEISKEWQAVDSFRKKIINYSRLKELSERLTLCLKQADTSSTLCAEVDQFFGHSDATIILYLFHSKTGELGISSSQKGQIQINLKDKKGDIFDDWVVKTMQPLLIEDTKSDYRFDLDKIQTEDSRAVRSLISIPLKVGNKAIGILRVDSSRERHFATEDLRLLTTIGDLGAIAIENAQLYEKLEDLAIRDSLTGLFLRRHMLERLSQEVTRVLRREKDLSLLMLDIDDFKQYNDRFGHVAGDIVLKTVAQLLTEVIKVPGNLVCRYGGEEFVVLLPDCSKKDAAVFAEKIRKKIEDFPIILRREKTMITVSIGVATLPVDAKIKDELIQKADFALYQAKQTGKNKFCVV